MMKKLQNKRKTNGTGICITVLLLCGRPVECGNYYLRAKYQLQNHEQLYAFD